MLALARTGSKRTAHLRHTVRQIESRVELRT